MLKVFTLGLLATLNLIAGPVAAQTYKVDPVDKSLSRFGAAAERFAKSGGDAAKMTEFRSFMEKFYFPSMTQSASSEALAEASKLRQNLFRNYIWKGTPEVQKYLTGEILKYAKRVIPGPYSPAVRFNALVALGLLDDTYATNQPPKVSAEANQLLCSLTASAVKSPKWPRNLLVGALVGLDRHTKYLGTLPRANQENTLKVLLMLAAVKDLGGDATPEVAEWIRLRGAAALANLKTPGEGNSILEAVTMIIADENLSIDGRCAAAAVLGTLKLEAGADAKPNHPSVVAVQSLAADFARSEAEFCEEFEDLQIGGGATASGISQRSKLATRIRTSLEQGQIELIRDGLIGTVKNLRDGLAAVKILAGDGAEQIGAQVAGLTSLVNTATDKDSLDLDLIAELKAICEKFGAEVGSEAEESAVEEALLQ